MQKNDTSCCDKALKHGETICPVCNKNLYEKPLARPVINDLKTVILVPLIALSLNACDNAENHEEGIVKDKIGNCVYMSPINDSNSVYRVIEFDTTHYIYGGTSLNILLNINKGDTLKWYNAGGTKYKIPAMYRYKSGIIGYATGNNIHFVNGTNVYKLPNLIKQRRKIQQQMQAQKEYNNIKEK